MASEQDRAQAISVVRVLEASPNRPIVVTAVLCQDNTRTPCPPCPPGADCARCLEPSWIFCDDPPITDWTRTLAAPGIPERELIVGHRYILKGQRNDIRGMYVEEVLDPGPTSSLPPASRP
jgi:hypothetical protein